MTRQGVLYVIMREASVGRHLLTGQMRACPAGWVSASVLVRSATEPAGTLGYPTLEAFKDAVASCLHPAEVLRTQKLDPDVDP